jgi:glucose dehydrogenase
MTASRSGGRATEADVCGWQHVFSKGDDMSPTSFTVAAALCAAFMSAAPTGHAAGSSDTGWAMYNGGYDSTRYSSLTQINTKNVASLREVARFKIPRL